MKEIEVDDAERVADECDRASQIEQYATEEAIKKCLARREKVPDDFDGTTCVDCGEDIPEARLKTGAFRDIDCQRKHEDRQRNHRSTYE